MEDIELSDLSEKISILRFIPDNNTKKNPLYIKNNTRQIIAISMKGLCIDSTNQFHEVKSITITVPGQIACIKQWNSGFKGDCEKFFIWDEDGILLNMNNYDQCTQNDDGVSFDFKSTENIRIKDPGVYALQEQNGRFTVEPIDIVITTAKKNPPNRCMKLFARFFNDK